MNPISVYIHPYIFYQERFSGIARYVCELAAHMERLGVKIHIPITETKNEYLLRAPFYPRTSAEVRDLPAWRKMLRSLIALRYPEKARKYGSMCQAIDALKRGKFDLIHPSYTNAADLLPHIGKTPLVVTVHDMTHELFPESFAPHDPTALRKKLYVEKASRIIAISENTKKDLVELYHIDPDLIDVIYHGNSLVLPSPDEEIAIDLPDNYILFVGLRGAYKNFDTFLRAFAAVASEKPELRLLCVGSGPFTKQEHALLHQLRIDDRAEQRALSDSELALSYKHARAFVYPSLYEGFGLPILEAFSCKAPVLCSRASCFPEIAGNAALYFDGKDPDSISRCMLDVLDSEKTREDLIAKGTERLRLFSWQRCAQETLRSYELALSCAR